MAQSDLPRSQGSERRFAAILFADIANFTQISEGLDLEEVTQLVNRCLDEIANGVLRHGGHLNKYIGDGLMSIFSHSQSHRQDAQNAVEAALTIQKDVASLDLGPTIPPLSLHVGIACGIILTTEMQSPEKRQYIIIGSAVNLASQLEDASEPGQTLVSADVYQLIKQDFPLRPISLSIPQNPKETLTAYELVK